MVKVPLFCPPTVGLFGESTGRLVCIRACKSCMQFLEAGRWLTEGHTCICGPEMSASDQEGMWLHLEKQVETEQYALGFSCWWLGDQAWWLCVL